MSDDDGTWWREGVIYQIYVRSFADTNGDGFGDLQGVIEHLDHLEWLGVDGVWLSPIHPSPDRDWGYDVAGYLGVHPELGDLETLDRLVADARTRGIRVILDLVPNHTSDLHPWFVDARSSMDATHRELYVWREPRPDGSPPNNWLSVFGGPAWELDEPTGQYYLHNFLPEQPDLDWWNDGVREEFEGILRFWFDRGIAGFRIDVANALIKDRALRDNDPAAEDDPEEVRRRGQRFIYNQNRPEVHEIYRRWRTIADSYEPRRILIGETWIFDLREVSRFYGETGDELDLCFNFPFVFGAFEAESLRAAVEAAEAALAPFAQPTWAASNHDVGRFATRWCGDRSDAARCALLALLCLRGTPFLYYGDEIGMVEVEVTGDAVRDRAGLVGGAQPGRDPGRTPMQWNADRGAGFTRPDTRPWLPIGDARAINVADQRSDPGSMLRLCRDLIALRRETLDLRSGRYTSLPSPAGAWAWRRGGDIIVAVNLSDEPSSIPIGAATIAIGTRRDRDGEPVEGALSLGPWEGAILRVAPS